MTHFLKALSEHLLRWASVYDEMDAPWWLFPLRMYLAAAFGLLLLSWWIRDRFLLSSTNKLDM
jgi:hypothetical protein